MPLNNEDEVKIYISYHANGDILKSGIMEPIHVGAAVSSAKLDILRDDSGENISDRNARYCELTAQYWAWKNVDIDYYGFMHYRRLFVFHDVAEQNDSNGFIILDKLTDECREHFGIYDNAIRKKIKGFDILIPYEVNVTELGAITNEQHFSSLEYEHAEDLNIVFETLLQLSPDYSYDLDNFRKGHKEVFCNMFIMKKEIFHNYCEWLFNILFQSEKKIVFYGYDKMEQRTVAMIAERLLNIYILHLRRMKPEFKIGNLKTLFIKRTGAMSTITPYFPEKNIPIAVSCNDTYLPYLGVMLTSMLENASTEYYYDILVLRNGAVDNSENHKQLIRKLDETVSKYGNLKLRYINVSDVMNGIDFPVTAHFSVETYFRLFLPQILPHYDKIIYLDADMIVLGDVSQLFEVDVKEYVLAATVDPIISSSEKCPFFNKGDYIKSLGVENIHNCFQAGVLVINLKKMAENNLDKKMIDYAATHSCQYVDQDVLNIFCQGGIKFLDLRWNVEITPDIIELVKYCPQKINKEYKFSRDNAYIYHFCGVDKPWHNPTIDFSDVFWGYARKTVYYEMLVAALVKSLICIPKPQGINALYDNNNQILSPITKSYLEMSEVGSSEIVTQKILQDLDDDLALQERFERADNILFYGGGVKCRELLVYFGELGFRYPSAVWDINAKSGQHIYQVPVLKPDFPSLTGENANTLCLIAIESKSVSHKVEEQFAEQGIDNVLEYSKIVGFIARKLWLKLAENEIEIKGGSI